MGSLNKQIKLRVEDNAEINSIMSQRGTLYVTLNISYYNDDTLAVPEIDIEWELDWMSNFSEEKTAIESSSDEYDEIVDTLGTPFSNADFFKLESGVEYDFAVKYINPHKKVVHIVDISNGMVNCIIDTFDYANGGWKSNPKNK